jgi:membrane protein implicated in regulation of membrane protease activity
MKHKTQLFKKVISAAFAGAFVVTPMMMRTPSILAAPNPMHSKNDHSQKHYETFTGSVIKTDSNQRFDIRVGRKTYNIKTAARLPYNLQKGDIVRVSGQRSDNNINYARVEILRKTTKDNGHLDESFTGIITKISSDRRFDIRINGKIFNAYTAGRLPSYLKRGDKVRITGRRSGSNDINNARVVKLSK